MPADLLRRLVAAEPARPLVTFYDDATGERIELSATTFDNWVAKTAGLLVDGLDAQPGTGVVLALPPHWQTLVWVFACWSAGLVVAPIEAMTETPPGAGDRSTGGPEITPAELFGSEVPYILATTEEGLDGAGAIADGAEDVVGLSLHSLGAPLRECPPGVTDFATEVRAYGDRFVPSAPIDPQAPALVDAMMKITFSGAQVVERARACVAERGIQAGARVLTDLSFAAMDGLFTGVIGPLSAMGSVIICRNLDKRQMDRRVSLEHVTAVAGVSGWGDPSRSVRRLI